jgi:hypothetical protein
MKEARQGVGAAIGVLNMLVTIVLIVKAVHELNYLALALVGVAAVFGLSMLLTSEN